MHLQSIRDQLLAEHFEALLAPVEDDLPERINIPMKIQELPADLMLQVLPVEQDDPSQMEGVEMLQFFVPFPLDVDREHEQDL